MSLLLPAGLAALAALLLPLLIHIARRSEEKRTVFAALRWLREKPKPRQRLRFDEWLLLGVRLLLLALLAVFLARPVLSGSTAGKPWVVAVPGVSGEEVRKIGGGAKSELHWLAPGFPAIGNGEVASTAAFPTLLRELDSKLPPATKLTVIVPARLAHADAQRIVLTRGVDWKIVPGELPEAGGAVSSLQLDLSRLPQDAIGLKYLRAINTAWKPDKPRAVVNIRVLPANQSAAAGIVFHPALRDAQGEVIVETAVTTDGTMLRFTRALAPATLPELLDPDFPARLHEALSPPPAPTRVFARDYSPQTGAMAYLQAPRDLKPWLAMLIALVFLIERFLATRTVRAVMP